MRRGEFERIERSPLHSRPQASAGLLPGYELNGFAVDLLKAAIDLLPPSFFRIGVDALIQTAD
jgi:hypothetical protein